MKRSDLLLHSAALGFVGVGWPLTTNASIPQAQPAIVPLAPPAGGVPVAFLLSDGAVMIDFAGPWEVLEQANVAGSMQPGFDLYTVAETTAPITISGGATLVPKYTFANAPPPKVVVVPAQSDATPAVKQWLVATARQADLIMSVCTGAFVLAEVGLLDGRTATTHHSAFVTLAMGYPNVKVVRGVRFVDSGSIATAAGLSAGIDLALHVVARYYGKDTAKLTAYNLEYQSNSWLDANNAAYLTAPDAKAGDAICAVCWMEVNLKNAPTLSYGGRNYYFCSTAHQRLFASSPQRFLNAS